MLYLCGLLWMWLLFCVVAVGLGAAYYFALDRPPERRREQARDEAERLLRSLRLQGVDEEALRHFVAKYAGTHWEGFYEALFGYEAKRAARESLKARSAAGGRGPAPGASR